MHHWRAFKRCLERRRDGWPTITPPTVPPAGPPEFDEEHHRSEGKSGSP